MSYGDSVFEVSWNQFLYLPTICPSLPVEKRSPLELELEDIASMTYKLWDFVQVRKASVWERLLSGKWKVWPIQWFSNCALKPCGHWGCGWGTTNMACSRILLLIDLLKPPYIRFHLKMHLSLLYCMSEWVWKGLCKRRPGHSGCWRNKTTPTLALPPPLALASSWPAGWGDGPHGGGVHKNWQEWGMKMCPKQQP